MGSSRRTIAPPSSTMMLCFWPQASSRLGKIDAAVRAAAFGASDGALGDGFGNDEHGFQIARKMPAGIEHARAFDAGGCGAGFQHLQFGQRALEIFAVRKIPTRLCIIFCKSR